MRACYYLIVFLGVALSYTDANIENSDIKNNLQDLNIPGLDIPKNLTDKIPTQEDAERLFEEKCRTNGGENAYINAKAARTKAEECIKGLVNMETLQQEMEKAKPTGDLDTVFQKYCNMSGNLTHCITDFTTSFEECLSEEERKSKDIVLNVTESLVGFICFKGGDRIALFIAEGGPECMNASQDAIKSCVQTAFKKHVTLSDEPSLSDIPSLLFQADQCQDFFELQKCVVKELEKCKEPTPANIVDSLFNFIKKVTPCAKFVPLERTESGKTSSATSISHFQFSGVILSSYALLRLIY